MKGGKSTTHVYASIFNPHNNSTKSTRLPVPLNQNSTKKSSVLLNL